MQNKRSEEIITKLFSSVVLQLASKSVTNERLGHELVIDTKRVSHESVTDTFGVSNQKILCVSYRIAPFWGTSTSTDIRCLTSQINREEKGPKKIIILHTDHKNGKVNQSNSIQSEHETTKSIDLPCNKQGSLLFAIPCPEYF